MFIAVQEDGGVRIYDTLDEIHRDHEPYDVESGAVVFYNGEGQYLEPVFSKPNRHRFFGLIVEPGEYSLEVAPDPIDVDPISLALFEARYLEPNAYFSSLDELRRRFPFDPSDP